MRTREEQIADLENQFGEEGTFAFVDDRDAATKHIIEAEQRGYERARAECAADTRRLEWLAECVSSIGGRHGEPLIWQIMFFSRSGVTDPKEIRAAIDAAMEVGNG